MTGRQRVLRMLEGRHEPGQQLPLMPITMMFAADRTGVKYGAYANDHRVLAEAQVRTAEEFDFDYVSVISDPAREAADLGARVVYFDDQPPALDEKAALLSDKKALAELRSPDPRRRGSRMHDRIEGVALLRRRVGDSKIVEGWIEGPCAQAADLRGINTLMLDFYDDPAFVRDLFEFVIDLETKFAEAQVEAGADLMGIGDAAASLVGPEIYNEFVWPDEKRLIEAVRRTGARTRLHICGNTRPLLGPIGRLGCDIVDLDYPAPISEARVAMGPKQVLLGNLHPVEVVCNGTPERITAALARCHAEAGEQYIVGAGCEIPRDTPPENLRAMCEYAHTHSPRNCGTVCPEN
jgi:MtaA/CmuA family methyltransferase